MERQYTEQEVTQVIRRAAELQERLAPGEPTRTHGVGEKELVRIAVELGLEERFVREAIGDPKTFAGEDKGTIASIDRTLERTAAALPGTKAFEIALDEFGPSGGIQGGPTQVGDSMTYQAMVGMTQCDMLVTRREGSTRVKVSTTTYIPFLVFGLLGGFFLLAGVVGLANVREWSEALRATVATGVGVVGLLALRTLVRCINIWSNKKVLERLDALVARLNGEAKEVSQAGDGGQAGL